MNRAREAHRHTLLLPACASLLLVLTACGGSISTEPDSRGPTTEGPGGTAAATPGNSSTPTGGAGSGSAGTGSGSTNNPGSTPDEGHFNIELHVTVTPKPGAEPQEYILQCDGTTPSDASNVPKPEAACVLVEESAQALFFTKPDPTLQCTQQYGGPQKATVSGTINGRPVEAKFARTDGCEISRWNAMEPLLGTGGVL